MNLKLIRIIDYYLGIIFIKILFIFKNHKKTTKNVEVKKILLIKFFGFGNLIMSSPILKELKNKYPKSDIDYLTLKNNKGILEGYPNFLNKIHYLDIGGISLINNSIKLLTKLRKKYDLIIDLDQFARYSAIITFLLNPKISIGYNTKNAERHYLYDYKVKYKANKHVVEEFNNLLIPLGIKQNKNLFLIKLKTDNIIKKKVNQWLKQNRIYDNKIIGIHTGTSNNATQRKWPYFKELIEIILKKTQFKIILTASPSEYEECGKLIHRLKVNKNLLKNIKISKGINLRELPELINNMDLFISNDTGPLHLAAAQKIKVIGLYGPNTPHLYGPYTKNKVIFYKKLKCSPCITNFNNKDHNCKNPICMKKISIKEVYNVIPK